MAVREVTIVRGSGITDSNKDIIRGMSFGITAGKQYDEGLYKDVEFYTPLTPSHPSMVLSFVAMGREGMLNPEQIAFGATLFRGLHFGQNTSEIPVDLELKNVSLEYEPRILDQLAQFMNIFAVSNTTVDRTGNGFVVRKTGASISQRPGVSIPFYGSEIEIDPEKTTTLSNIMTIYGLMDGGTELVTYAMAVDSLTSILFSFPRWIKCMAKQGVYLDALIDRMPPLAPSINKALLKVVATYLKFDRWRSLVEFPTAFTAAHAINSANLRYSTLQIDQRLISVCGFGLVTTAFRTFTPLTLLVEISRSLDLTKDVVLVGIPHECSVRFSQLMVSRKNDLVKTPCWYGISAACINGLESDFSATKHPTLTETFKNIIANMIPAKAAGIMELKTGATKTQLENAEILYEIFNLIHHVNKFTISLSGTDYSESMIKKMQSIAAGTYKKKPNDMNPGTSHDVEGTMLDAMYHR